MKFDTAIDAFVADMRAEGRMNSANSERAYREVLAWHSEDVGNRDPATVGKEDVKKTLRRWTEPASRAQRHAILNSFYDWAVYEDLRPANPARQVRPTRVKPKQKARLTREEIVALLDAAHGNRRDRWAINLMLYAGLRNAEVRGLRGRDLARQGWIRIVGKGDKERWAPVVPELVPIVDEIRTLIHDEDYVLPGRRSLNPPLHTLQRDAPQSMLSSSALRKQTIRIGHRAGIALEVHPHLLRHAYGDAVARYSGVRTAQTVLGHSSIETTVGTYTGGMTLDEIAASMSGFGYRDVRLPLANHPSKAPSEST